ncbi:MAG: hypothetical protein R3293_15935, partial [Candidatus Promineifilaceae bacterium]|nr:hypothetical protein [Candidatus Promineifilaceae bacterium]
FIALLSASCVGISQEVEPPQTIESTPLPPTQPPPETAEPEAPTEEPPTPTAEPTLESEEPQPTAAAGITAVPFDLGEFTLLQKSVPEQLREMPVELEGLIAAPPEGDNLPLAVIIHGSHGVDCPVVDDFFQDWPCPEDETKHYGGFDYLLEALAERGYAAISINANSTFVSAFGEPDSNARLVTLVDLYLNQVAAANAGDAVDFGVDLAGRVDLNTLVILGHSASGQGAGWVVGSRAGSDSPEQIAAGEGPFSAAFLLAPVPSNLPEDGLALPFAVLLPACDEDVADLAGQTYYEAARQSEVREDAALSVYLRGANHTRFNSLLLSDEGLAEASAVCDDALISPAEHQQFLAELAGSFFDDALGRGEGDPAAIGLDAGQPAPSELLGQQVLTSLALPADQRSVLPLADGQVNGDVSAVFCEQGFAQKESSQEACRRDPVNQPGNPEQLVLSWSGPGAVYEVSLPQGMGDLSAYDILHLRAAVDPMSPLNIAGEAQPFTLRLTDGSGSSASIVLDETAALAFPEGEVRQIGDFTGWDNLVLLSSIRLPLSDFSGIDLSDVQSISFLFDQTDSGAIFVTDLELLDVP